jgi:AraC-like DNA-binding protein
LNGIDRERAKLFRHPRFRDTLFLRASFTRHRYELHTHPTYVIGLVTRGVERLRVGARTYLAPEGSIILVNPEEPHDGEPGAEGGWAYRTLYRGVALLSQVSEEMGASGAPGFAGTVIGDGEAAAALLRAHQLAEAGDTLDAEASLLLALRRLISRHAGLRLAANRPCSASLRRLARYRDFIEANLAAPIDLAALADLAGVTRFQVIRDFRQGTGLTPGAFIRLSRQTSASRLIEQGVPLAEAAAAAGFADQSHLCRVFRAIQGVTPSMFKAACARA